VVGGLGELELGADLVLQQTMQLRVRVHGTSVTV
jgi:hypothetical protein